jgi:hypothetical protein
VRPYLERGSFVVVHSWKYGVCVGLLTLLAALQPSAGYSVQVVAQAYQRTVTRVDTQGSMWLPQSAEVYFDWRGHRAHRRHSFTDYMLFSIDDKQQIADPEKGIPSSRTSAKSKSRPN